MQQANTKKHQKPTGVPKKDTPKPVELPPIKPVEEEVPGGILSPSNIMVRLEVPQPTPFSFVVVPRTPPSDAEEFGWELYNPTQSAAYNRWKASFDCQGSSSSATQDESKNGKK